MEAQAPNAETVSQVDAFLSAYMKNLIIAKNKFPKLYEWKESDVLEVFRRMASSFRQGLYSRHCHAVRMTCKELGIKNTREAIDAIFQPKNEGEKQ